MLRRHKALTDADIFILRYVYIDKAFLIQKGVGGKIPTKPQGG